MDNQNNEIRAKGENADMFAEYLAFSQKYPTPEQAFVRLAIEKALTPKQQKVWDWYNYDRLTTVEIAKKLKIDQSNASRQIKTIEKQIALWIESHKQAYDVIKEAQDANDQGC